MRSFIFLLVLFIPLIAFGNPSTEARMQFASGGNQSCSRLNVGLTCILKIAIGETERATGQISFLSNGLICVNGDTASTIVASLINLTWRQTIDKNTENGSVPNLASSIILNGGSDCYPVVGAGYLQFDAGPATETSILLIGQ